MNVYDSINEDEDYDKIRFDSFLRVVLDIVLEQKFLELESIYSNFKMKPTSKVD